MHRVLLVPGCLSRLAQAREARSVHGPSDARACGGLRDASAGRGRSPRLSAPGGRDRLLQHHEVLHRSLSGVHYDHRQRDHPAQRTGRRRELRSVGGAVAKTHRLSPADALLQAYSASGRVNQYLVEQLHPAVWRAPSPFPKGRTIAALVAHMHNCALRYLERTAPDTPVPAELDRHLVTRAQAIRALGAKRKAMLSIVGAALTDNDRIVGSPHDAAGFLMYYIITPPHIAAQSVRQRPPPATPTPTKPRIPARAYP